MLAAIRSVAWTTTYFTFINIVASSDAHTLHTKCSILKVRGADLQLALLRDFVIFVKHASTTKRRRLIEHAHQDTLGFPKTWRWSTTKPTGLPKNAKSTTMHRHSSSEHNNWFAYQLQSSRHLLTITAESTGSRQQAASIASRATHKLRASANPTPSSKWTRPSINIWAQTTLNW